MSVHYLTKPHIDVLVNALREYGILSPDTTHEEYVGLGQQLWDKATDRYNSRYGKEAHPSYVLHALAESQQLNPQAVLSAIEFYEGTAQWWPECLTTLRECILRQHPHLAHADRAVSDLPSADPYVIPRPFYDLTDALDTSGERIDQQDGVGKVAFHDGQAVDS